MILHLISCTPTAPTPPDVVPVDSLALIRNAFKPAAACQSCHPNHYQEWQGSMHAYAFTDPVFFALNDIGQGRSGNKLDQFCIKCHSPVAPLLKEAPPGFDPAALSEIVKDGISCESCHRLKSATRGKGIDSFHLEDTRYGPISDPVENSFHTSVGSRDYKLSGFCSACHDVINENGLRVEQTSTEWDKSEYAIMSTECQDCHMPAYQGQAATGGPVRTVHRHNFTGVDVPLTPFPGREDTIEQVRQLLENSVTMDVDMPAPDANGETRITVHVRNDFTGHNIPTGTIFERQMWLHVSVIDIESTGEHLLQSGHLDMNGDLFDHHSEFVKNGALPADSLLTLFNGTPLKNGVEIPFFWEADSVINRSIPAFQTRTAVYPVSGLVRGKYFVLVRLRFRSFPPWLLREIGQPALIDEVHVFEMEKFKKELIVE